MTRLRVATRGSELALRQTRWVCDRLRELHPDISCLETVIQTHGDVHAQQPLDADFPAGGFVSAIEKALLDRRVDVAVHSYKDLPTHATPGLTLAAVPRRETANDVLITRDAVDLEQPRTGLRIGTSSPRRAAQLRRWADVVIVPIRGNVPTRIAQVVEGRVDAVVLAGAGIRRLGLHPPNLIELPIEPFVPAPAQGALAVQAREGDGLIERLASLDDAASRRTVESERSFLRNVFAGCQTPVGASATLDGPSIRLRGQLFTDDGARVADGVEFGDVPKDLGKRLAERLRAMLGVTREG